MKFLSLTLFSFLSFRWIQSDLFDIGHNWNWYSISLADIMSVMNHVNKLKPFIPGLAGYGQFFSPSLSVCFIMPEYLCFACAKNLFQEWQLAQLQSFSPVSGSGRTCSNLFPSTTGSQLLGTLVWPIFPSSGNTPTTRRETCENSQICLWWIVVNCSSPVMCEIIPHQSGGLQLMLA